MGQTITEKIFSEHVGHQVFAGEIIRSNIDMVIGNDITTPTAKVECTYRDRSCNIVSNNHIDI